MRAAVLLALTTGFLGGFGHCAGMCGPLVASLGMVAAPRLGARRALGGQVLYHCGRIATYAFIGALMGLSGSFVNTAGRLAGLQEAVAVGAGGLMILMGLGASGIAPGLRRLEARLASRTLGGARAMLEDGGAGRFFALGLALGFLPCGLSYSAFVGAAATGGLPQGMLYALAFAVGTVPALLVMGAAATALSARVRGVLQRLGAFLVVLVGALFLLRGLGVHAPL